jgi:hypothetical protein
VGKARPSDFEKAMVGVFSFVRFPAKCYTMDSKFTLTDSLLVQILGIGV